MAGPKRPPLVKYEDVMSAFAGGFYDSPWSLPDINPYGVKFKLWVQVILGCSLVHYLGLFRAGPQIRFEGPKSGKVAIPMLSGCGVN